MPMTLGSHSPKLAAARALLTKAGRREQGRFSVAGLTMLEEALGAGRLPEEVYIAEGALALPAPFAGRLSDRTFVVAARALGRLSDLATPPGVIAVHRCVVEDAEAVLAAGGPVLALAGVSDPGNAGTLLRSAEIFGFGAALFGDSAVEPHNPKLVRATMGALFRLRIGTGSMRDIFAAARRLGYAVVAADRSGCPLAEFLFPPKPLILVGHERHGVGEWLSHADHVVAVPQSGAGQSLNAAVAGSIVCYAFSQASAQSNGR